MYSLALGKSSNGHRNRRFNPDALPATSGFV
jgi:hypothetical protein